MAELYGHAWTSQFGEKDHGTWYKGLRHLSANEVAEGLGKCLEREEKKWPPGLAEFRGMCRPKKHGIHKMFISLPKPDADIELGEKALDDMRKILKKDSKRDLLQDMADGIIK